jgi:hypothetical protein
MTLESRPIAQNIGVSPRRSAKLAHANPPTHDTRRLQTPGPEPD